MSAPLVNPMLQMTFGKNITPKQNFPNSTCVQLNRKLGQNGKSA